MTQASDAPPAADFTGLEMIVEKMAINRRSEEAARVHIHLSMSVQNQRDLIAALSEQIKNVVFVGFGFMQQSLPFPPAAPAKGINSVAPISSTSAPDPTVSHLVDKDGEVILPHGFRAGRPDRSKCVVCEQGEAHGVHAEAARAARMKRSRVPNETAQKLAAMQQAAEAPHVFDHNPEDGMCVRCGHAPEMPVHQDVPSYRDRVAYWQTHGGNNADEALSIGMAASCAMDDAEAGNCLPMTDEDKAWFDALDANDEGLSDLGAKLIEDAALTPALAEG